MAVYGLILICQLSKFCEAQEHPWSCWLSETTRWWLLGAGLPFSLKDSVIYGVISWFSEMKRQATERRLPNWNAGKCGICFIYKEILSNLEASLVILVFKNNWRMALLDFTDRFWDLRSFREFLSTSSVQGSSEVCWVFRMIHRV